MTKIAIKGRLALDDMQGTWEKSRETLVASLGDLQDGVVAAVNGGLSSENTTSTHENYVLTHNTTIRIKNPLSVPCVGIWAVRCVGLEVSGGKPTRKLYALSKPEIDWEPADSADDTLLVTARYPAPVGACSAYQAGAQSPTNNSEITFDTQEFASGSMSLSGGRIVCAKAGFVSVNISVCWDADAAGNYRGFFVSNSVTSNRYISERCPSETASSILPMGSGSALIEMAAGAYPAVTATHDSGAGVALSVGNNRTRIDARYVAPPAGTTGKVTLFFYGG